MADSTLVGVAIGGGIGLLSAVGAGFVTGHFNLRTARVHADVEGARLDAEHRRRDLEHRQGVYHDFLNALSRIEAVATTGTTLEQQSYSPEQAEISKRQFLDLIVVARDRLNGILLFGTGQVAATGESFDRVFARAEARVRAEAQLGDLTGLGAGAAFRAWGEVTGADDWRNALGDLRAAMRADVAPQNGPAVE